MPIAQPLDTLTIHSHKPGPETLVSAHPGVPLVSSSKDSHVLVNTQIGTFKTVGDDELLASLVGHPAALLRRADGSAQLVFVNPADTDGFPAPAQ